jgi:hypothetical protein
MKVSRVMSLVYSLTLALSAGSALAGPPQQKYVRPLTPVLLQRRLLNPQPQLKPPQRNPQRHQPAESATLWSMLPNGIGGHERKFSADCAGWLQPREPFGFTSYRGGYDWVASGAHVRGFYQRG